LLADGIGALLDLVLVAGAVDDGRVVLIDNDPLGAAEEE